MIAYMATTSEKLKITNVIVRKILALVKISWLSVCSLLSTMPNQAIAEPISILGLSWAEPAMIPFLEGKGYSCEKTAKSTTHDCKASPNKKITVGAITVRFSCSTFNGCQKDIVQVKNALISNGIIKYVQEEAFETTDNKGKWDIAKRYCTQGEEGDRLCVEPAFNELGLPTVEIILSKGDFGSGEINFD